MTTDTFASPLRNSDVTRKESSENLIGELKDKSFMSSSNIPLNTSDHSNFSSVSSISNSNSLVDSTFDFIHAWLTYLSVSSPQLELYKEALLSEAFDDFNSVVELNESDLDDFEIKRGHKKKILRWIEEMKDEEKKKNFLIKIGLQHKVDAIGITPDESDTYIQATQNIQTKTNQNNSESISTLQLINTTNVSNQQEIQDIQIAKDTQELNDSLNQSLNHSKLIESNSLYSLNQNLDQESNLDDIPKRILNNSSLSYISSISKSVSLDSYTSEKRLFLQFIQNAIYLLASHQTELFITVSFHPVDIASFRNLGLSVTYLAEKFDSNEANCTKKDILQLFEEILKNKDEQLLRILPIKVPGRYGGTHEYRSENGSFLFRYLNNNNSNLPTHRWFMCNFPRER